MTNKNFNLSKAPVLAGATKVVVMNGSRISMRFTGTKWLNVKVLPV